MLVRRRTKIEKYDYISYTAVISNKKYTHVWGKQKWNRRRQGLESNVTPVRSFINNQH